MRKIVRYTSILLLLFTLSKGNAQSIYKTGFDSEKEKEGWVQFQLGKKASSSWEVVAKGKDDSDCLIHYAPTGDADKDSLVNWYISPRFDLSEGGKIDSLSYNYFSFFETFLPEQHVGVYLLKGKNNPIEASEVIKIADFTSFYSGDDSKWRDTGDFQLPVTFDDAFLAFKFVAIDGWSAISYDNLQITQNKTSSIEFKTQISFSVNPNPARTEIKIKSTAKINELKIYNYAGQMVLTSKDAFIDVSELPKGVYHVEINTQQGTVSKKLLIQ